MAMSGTQHITELLTIAVLAVVPAPLIAVHPREELLARFHDDRTD
jgi:hypothetical protein